MKSDNALFDDDLEFDIDDDMDVALSSVFEDAPEPPVNAGFEAEDADLALDLDLDAPMKPIEPIADLSTQGGERAIPAISIGAFCETGRTAQLVASVSRDRRMSQASLDLHEGGLEAAITYLSENPTPNLLILESTENNGTMLAQIDELAGHCDEGVQVMVIGAVNDISLYRQLMARGVSEYLVPPITPVQVIRSISNLFSDPDAPFVGKSISVIGAKGGVGASTIAHNLAWSMSENVRVNTALVDLDLSFGTTSLDFNQESQQTVADALLAPERVDDAVISRLLSKATDKLSLFTAPASVGQVIDVHTEAYQIVIDGVRRVMPYVVLDLPHGWNRWQYNTLVSSDEVILVCQPDLASLRNGKNILDKLKADRPNDAAPRVILNMMGVPKRPEIPAKDFAGAMGVEPEVIIPFDPQLFGTASNNGQMISETDATAAPAVEIDRLASFVTGQTVAVERKSLLKKLLGK